MARQWTARGARLDARRLEAVCYSPRAAREYRAIQDRASYWNVPC